VIAKEEAEFERRRLLKHTDRGPGNVRDSVPETSVKQLRAINKFLMAANKEILVFRKNELGLEVVIQLVIQLMMLLLSPNYTTHTATHSGLQAIFERDFTSVAQTASNYGLHMPGKIEDTTKGLLIFSLLWSIRTAATSYIKIKTQERLELFTFLSKSVLGLRSLLVYAVRVTCILAFFGPSLGLLDCLAHWKAAQLTKNPPHFTEWTVISLGESLAVFSALLFFQMAFMTLLKWFLSEDFKDAIEDGNWSSLTQHLLLSVNIPDNYKDWDQGGGSLRQHLERRLKVNQENVAMIIVHNISNFLLLVPLWTTAHNAWETHLTVLQEGPAFPEETAAADNLWTLSLVLPVIVALSALVDLVLVFIFQNWFHPLREIIVNINNRERPTIEMASFDEGEI